MKDHLCNEQSIRDLSRLVKMDDHVQVLHYHEFYEYLNSMNRFHMTIKHFETVVSLLQKLEEQQIAGYKVGDENTSFRFNRATNVRDSKRYFIEYYIRDNITGGREYNPKDTIKLLTIAHKHCTSTIFLTIAQYILGEV